MQQVHGLQYLVGGIFSLGLILQKEKQIFLLPTHFVGQVPARLRRLEPVNAVLAHRPSALSAAHIKVYSQLNPVGSTVRYEMYWVSIGHYEVVAVSN